jgi:predicted anti-sigma-YlaC factor YlaD
MTCEHCQEQISAFLDNDLDETSSANIQTHLAVCPECAKVCEDFASILDFCQIEEPHEILPSNSQAMWCRISNTIEGEIKAELIQEAKEKQHQQQEEIKKSWFSRGWSLSLSQVASAVLGIAVISSLLTFIGIKNYSAGTSGDILAHKSLSDSAPTFLDKALGKLGLVETPDQIRERRITEQTALIDYWNKRVEARRAQWDANLRDAFDRNLNEINQAVNEYTLILQENPQDELSTEMLDSAMTEKVDLLREFSEL